MVDDEVGVEVREVGRVKAEAVEESIDATASLLNMICVLDG